MDWDDFLVSVLKTYAQEDGLISKESFEDFTQKSNPSTSSEIVKSTVETHFDYICQQRGIGELDALTIPEILELYQESYESDPDTVKGELKHHGWVDDTYSLEIVVNSGVWSDLDGIYSFQPDQINDSPTYKHENQDLILWKFDLPKKKGKKKKYVWMISKEEHLHTQNAYACCRDGIQDPRLIPSTSSWMVWEKGSGKFIPDDAFRIEERFDWECL